jgi:hypothetical protein
MVNLGLMIEYEKFKANAIESITPFVFPWKINVEVLSTDSYFEFLKGSFKSTESKIILSDEKKEDVTVRDKHIDLTDRSATDDKPTKMEELHPVKRPGMRNEIKTTIPEEPAKKVEGIERKDMANRIVEILQRYGKGLNNFHIVTEIPGEKLKNARKKCKIPEEETVLGLLDLTVKGSAKNCLVFGTKGIYFHNSIFSKEPGKRFIQYEKYKNLNFELYGKYEIDIGDKHSLNVSIFGQKEDQRIKIIEVLDRLKDLFNRYL